MSRGNVAALAAAVVLLLGPSPSRGQDDAGGRLQQFIEANTQARGGREVLGAVQVIEYELTIEEPAYLDPGLFDRP